MRRTGAGFAGVLMLTMAMSACRMRDAPIVWMVCATLHRKNWHSGPKRKQPWRRRRPAPFRTASGVADPMILPDSRGSHSVKAIRRVRLSRVRAEGVYKFPKAEAATGLYVERKAVEKQIEEAEKLPPDKMLHISRCLRQMKVAYEAAPRRSRKDPPFTPEQQAQVDRAMAEGKYTRRCGEEAGQATMSHQ